MKLSIATCIATALVLAQIGAVEADCIIDNTAITCASGNSSTDLNTLTCDGDSSCLDAEIEAGNFV